MPVSKPLSRDVVSIRPPGYSTTAFRYALRATQRPRFGSAQRPVSAPLNDRRSLSGVEGPKCRWLSRAFSCPYRSRFPPQLSRGSSILSKFRARVGSLWPFDRSFRPFDRSSRPIHPLRRSFDRSFRSIDRSFYPIDCSFYPIDRLFWAFDGSFHPIDFIN